MTGPITSILTAMSGITGNITPLQKKIKEKKKLNWTTYQILRQPWFKTSSMIIFIIDNSSTLNGGEKNEDVDDVILFVFMNKGFAPSLTDHHQNCTLPNPYPKDWHAWSAHRYGSYLMIHFNCSRMSVCSSCVKLISIFQNFHG